MPLLGSKLGKFFFKIFVFVVHDEAYVHDRTVFGYNGATEKFVTIDFIVENGGFFDIHFFEHFHAAQFFVVFEGLQSGRIRASREEC